MTFSIYPSLRILCCLIAFIASCTLASSANAQSPDSTFSDSTRATPSDTVIVATPERRDWLVPHIGLYVRPLAIGFMIEFGARIGIDLYRDRLGVGLEFGALLGLPDTDIRHIGYRIEVAPIRLDSISVLYAQAGGHRFYGFANPDVFAFGVGMRKSGLWGTIHSSIHFKSFIEVDLIDPGRLPFPWLFVGVLAEI